MISFEQAYQLTIERIRPLGEESVQLIGAVGRVASRPLSSKVDSPTADVSLKDGYALRSVDIQTAAEQNPLPLKIVGTISAGGEWAGEIGAGETVRILSGARIPAGADAVLAEEYTRTEKGTLFALADAAAGRNILPAGNDIYVGKPLIEKGERLSPMKVGLLASAGYMEVPVHRLPRVAIIATGDEVVAPGNPLPDGKLYASNLVTLAGWCVHFGLSPETFVVPDDAEKIETSLRMAFEGYDVVLTSGGAWKGDRDLVAKILDRLGWEKVFHRIKIGPGKAVGFGLYMEKPVFLLPGGPPSNHMAFLQIVVPALLSMAGWGEPGFPKVPAILAETLRGQIDWTQFVHGRLETDEKGEAIFFPSTQTSRLQMMAASDAVAMIPEGCDEIFAGTRIMVQKLA